MQYLPAVLFLIFAVCFVCSANSIIKPENVVNASSIPNTSVTQIDGNVGESTTIRSVITASPGIAASTLNNTVTTTVNATTVSTISTTSKPLSSKGTTPKSTPASTTAKSTLAPNSSSVTTAVPHHERKFDGPSFVGGIILALSMVAIGFVGFKFYKTRTELNYHTL